MRTHAPSEAPVTLQEIEAALTYVAPSLKKHGDACSPIQRRLECDVQAARQKESRG